MKIFLEDLVTILRSAGKVWNINGNGFGCIQHIKALSFMIDNHNLVPKATCDPARDGPRLTK